MNGYNDNILKDGPWGEYWINGKLGYSGNYSNGKLGYKVNYVNGKKHGLFERYHSNGNLRNLEFFL